MSLSETDRGLPGGRGCPAQARIAFRSLETILETTGASVFDVVGLTTFLR